MWCIFDCDGFSSTFLGFHRDRVAAVTLAEQYNDRQYTPGQLGDKAPILVYESRTDYLRKYDEGQEAVIVYFVPEGETL